MELYCSVMFGSGEHVAGPSGMGKQGGYFTTGQTRLVFTQHIHRLMLDDGWR